MSYDVRLRSEDGQVLPAEHFAEGGTRKLFGTNECDLNITGNYWQIWRLIDWEPREMHGKRARDTEGDLRNAFERLGGGLPSGGPKPWPDYWAPTPGNALAVVTRLWEFAKAHPDGTWEVG